jgi:hypothetical protein
MTDAYNSAPTGSSEVQGPPPAQDSEQSLSELLSELTSQLSLLFRKEVELAQVEVKAELRRAGKAGGAFGGAGFAAYLAVLMLSFAAAWGLAALMPTGLAFLIVGLVYAVAAGVLYMGGRRKLEQINPKPEQTVETLKEDAEWIKSRRS